MDLNNCTLYKYDPTVYSLRKSSYLNLKDFFSKKFFFGLVVGANKNVKTNFAKS